MNKLSLSYCVRLLSILFFLSGIATHLSANAATLVVTIAKTKGITCRGNTDGIFKATPTGGTAPYTYLWSNGDTGQSTTSGLAPGTYTCTVKDAVGATATSTGLLIAAPGAIAITASTQTNVTTSGGSDGTATVTAGGGTQPYTYSWISSTSVIPAGNGTNQATGLTAGTWTVSVSDNNGCTAATKTFTITQPTALTVTIAKTKGITCRGNTDGIFKATPSGGTAPYTYLWSNGDTGQSTTTGLAPGTYICTVTDNVGATVTSSGLLIAAPGAITITASTQTNVTIATGADGMATVTVGGGTAPYTYSWSPTPPAGNGTNQASGLTAGTWTVSVSDVNGCTAATKTFTITQPTAAIYYSKSTGDLSLLTTYGTSPDGTGTAPADFNGSGANGVYQLANRGSYSLTSNLTIGSTLNIPVSSTLDIAGNTLTLATLTGSGTLTGSNSSSLVVNGSVSGLSFTTGQEKLGSLTLGSGASLTLSSLLAIASTGSVTLGNNATLNTNNTLTLRSDVSGTAQIAALGTGAVISGNVTAERYIADKRAWRLITSSVNSSQSINAAWQEGAAGTTNNPNPGYGTFIIGNSTANGFDIANSPGSLLAYNGISFNSVANTTSTTVSANTGYFLFSIGNRGVNPATAGAHSFTILRSSGTVLTGTQTANITATGYTLVGNPYPAPVDFANITKSATVPDQFYAWDINLGTYGGYVLISRLGGSYTSIPTSPSGLNNIIPSGAAIFVQSNGSTAGTLTFNESSKAGTGNGTFSSFATSVVANNNHELRINLTDAASNLVDGVMASFVAGYSNQVDVNDAYKLPNFYENISINRAGKQLTLERRNDISAKDTIFIQLSGMTTSQYNLQINPNDFNQSSGLKAYLEDAYLHTITKLDLSQTSSVPFNTTATDTASYKNRFQITFNPETPNSITKISHIGASVVAYPNPVKQKQINLSFDGIPAGNYNITVTNTFGQVMQKSSMNYNGSTANKLLNMDYATGMYTVSIQSAGYNQAIKIIIP